MTPRDRVSDQLAGWLHAEGDKTLGGLVEAFETQAFAVLFVLLLAVPALPLPTGGATHVFEVIAMLLSLELIAGRDHVWLPARWRRMSLAGVNRRGFVERLLRMIRRLERLSRPRGRWVFRHRLSGLAFGVTLLLLSLAAFLAPPFSGLDTLPALGAVVVSLAVLLEDAAILIGGLAMGAAGILLELVLGKAAFSGLEQLFSIVGQGA
jgi:hypothetical protein